MDSGSEEELPDIIGPLEVLYCGSMSSLYIILDLVKAY